VGGGSPLYESGGNLYGTSAGGGTAGMGAVYKLDPAGALTVLYSFKGGDDGWEPAGIAPAGVIVGSDGNIYGTTYFGGGPYNRGTVFRIDAAGNERILYRFTRGADGGLPRSGLVRDEHGNLYGTTIDGGYPLGCATCYGGVVFKLDQDGHETVLHAFHGPDR
jgi:uncharacterized repeat protein (TIGR03803 family)